MKQHEVENRGEPATRVTVRMPQRLKHSVEALAFRTGRSENDIMATAIAEYMAKRKRGPA